MLCWIKKFLNIKSKEQEFTISEKTKNLYYPLNEVQIQIFVGEDLTKYTDCISDVFEQVREEIKYESGFVIPPIKITGDYLNLQDNEFGVYICGEKVYNEFLIPNEEGIRKELYDMLKTVMNNNIHIIFSSEILEKYINAVHKNILEKFANKFDLNETPENILSDTAPILLQNKFMKLFKKYL